MPDNAARTMKQEASRDCQGDASTGSRIQRGKESLVNGPDLDGKT